VHIVTNISVRTLCSIQPVPSGILSHVGSGRVRLFDLVVVLPFFVFRGLFGLAQKEEGRISDIAYFFIVLPPTHPVSFVVYLFLLSYLCLYFYIILYYYCGKLFAISCM